MSKRRKKLPKKRQNSDYWIYGHHAVVGALLNKNRQKYEIYFTPEAERKLRKEVSLDNHSIHTKLKTREEIHSLLKGVSNHQGICIRVDKIQIQDLKEFLKQFNDKNSIIVLLDQLEDPQNVGAIFRSALAFNIDGIILTDNNSVTENPFLVKTASSAIDKVPFTKIKNISSCIKTLKDNGYWIYGLDMNTNNNLHEINFSDKIVIVLGSEGRGMRNITSSLCDENIKIQINDELESLNVSNAAAVMFYYLSQLN